MYDAILELEEEKVHEMVVGLQAISMQLASNAVIAGDHVVWIG
jgi:hypothetical protein